MKIHIIIPYQSNILEKHTTGNCPELSGAAMLGINERAFWYQTQQQTLKKQEYAQDIKAKENGYEIEVILDLQTKGYGSIAYIINGKNYGFAFDKLKNETESGYRLYAAIHCGKDQIIKML